MTRKLPLLMSCIVVIVLSVASTSRAWGWGPHVEITKAAQNVVPDAERWKHELGEANWADLSKYCLLPDQRGRDLGDFYADDYLLTRETPQHIRHVMPFVKEAFAPSFRRALQALRTETPVNASRQLGALIHFVEDAGAPPHAKEQCPYHTKMENWVRAEQITIDGYQPRLLGNNDDEALAGLLQRVAELVEFSKARAERALPLVQQTSPDRAQVEAILLESALESARATADVLHTVLTLGLAPQPDGAGLAGTVTADLLPQGDDHGARILLLDTNYTTLATTLTPRPTGPNWQGSYAFSHLPPGTYNVLAYRTGSQSRTAKKVVLEAGKVTRLDFALPPTSPRGNLIENPEGQVAYVQAKIPDRWRASEETGAERTWVSAPVSVKPGVSYYCGAAVKDPATKVRFRFRLPTIKGKPAPPDTVYSLTFSDPPLSWVNFRADKVVLLDAQPWKDVVVEIQTSQPLTDVLRSVWVAQ